MLILEDYICSNPINLESEKAYRLRQIIHAYHDQLMSILMSFTTDRHLCEDLLQEAYIRLWDNLDNLADDAEAIFVLKRYTRNLFLDEMRKMSRREALIVKMGTGEALSVSAEEQAIERERYEIIQVAVRKLPEQQRLIFQMHKEQAMSYKQIAEKLGIATGTIEKQMTRALKFLRQELGSLRITDQAMAFIWIYYALSVSS